MIEIIKLTPVNDQQQNDASSWIPEIGPAARKIAENNLQEKAAQDELLNSSQQILLQGISPTEKVISRTGLVVGYVQSGKTLSFTTVLAMARDNGFKLMIVITGKSEYLFEQSTERLEMDLVDKTPYEWRIYTSPSLLQDTTNQKNLKRVINATAKSESLACLITVMKHHSHLHAINEVLEQSELDGVPVVIIDDEADQASLNTKVKNDEQSATYQLITDMRNAVGAHNFLQYTATPQAPLLISILDLLSPDYVEILKPGENYVGGDTFFKKNSNYYSVIPPSEIKDAVNPDFDVPESLMKALRLFFLGAATTDLQRSKGQKLPHRSMLIHPDIKIKVHETHSRRISELIDHWCEQLEDSDPEYRGELLEDFKNEHQQLRKIKTDLPSWEKCRPLLYDIMIGTVVNVRNATKKKGNRRTMGPRAIVIGSKAIDRGVTINGLTVTYIPRTIKSGNIDNIQQWARFFGYKKDYLDLCCIFITQDLLDFFRDYVKHEETLRAALIEYKKTRTDFKKWKRNFYLSNNKNLKLCRAAVIKHNVVSAKYANNWHYPNRITIPGVNNNRAIVRNFKKLLDDRCRPQKLQYGKKARPNFLYQIPLEFVYKKLLVLFQSPEPTTSQNMATILSLLRKNLDSESPDANVYIIRPGEQAIRTMDNEGKIVIPQGRNPDDPKGYKGDRHLEDYGKVSIQLHNYTIRNSKKEIYAENVDVIGFRLPKDFYENLLVQNQPEQNSE